MAATTSSVSFTVTAGTPALTVSLSSASIVYGAAAPTLGSTSDSPGTVSYSSSATQVATVSGSTITVVGIGTTTITATQAATSDGTYTSRAVTTTLTVTAATPSFAGFALSSPSAVYGGTAPTVTAPTTNSAGAISYTSSDTNVATINRTTGAISLVGIGSVTLTASLAANGNYASATLTEALTVAAATPTLSGFSLSSSSVAYGSTAPSIVAPTTPSAGAITYTSSDTGVATVNGTTITIIRAGSTTLTATQAANGNYSSASATTALTVTAAPPSISVALSSTSVTYGGTAPTLTASSNSAGAISYSSSNTGIATIDGSTGAITIVGIGTTTLTVSQLADGNYASGSDTVVLTVKAIIPPFSGFALSSTTITYGDAAPTIIAPTSVSAGVISYSSSNAGAATIDPSTGMITIHGVGTTTFTATQAADGNYSTVYATASLTVVPLTPTFAVSLSASSVRYGATAPTLAVTSDSAGAVTYRSSDPAVATVSGSIITLVGVGSTTITATQAAAGNYAIATGSAALSVTQATPNLSISLSSSSLTYGSTAPTLNYTSDSSGTVTYVSSDTSVATISGSTITTMGKGTTTITATQAATTNFTASTAAKTLTVSVGTPAFNVSLTSSSVIFGSAAPTISSTSASAGAVTYTSSNPSVATIDPSTGVIAILDAGSVTFTASQAADGNYTAVRGTASLTVLAATPALSLALSSTSSVYGATAPTLGYTSNSAGSIAFTSSDPAVATIDGSTGVITVVGIGSVTFTGTQAASGHFVGVAATATLTITAATPTLAVSLSSANVAFAGAAPTLSATSNSAGTITYSSSDPAVATVSGSTITLVGVGTTVITATQSTDGNYAGSTANVSLTVYPIVPTLLGFTLSASTVSYGGTAPTLSYASDSAGAVTYVSSDSSVARISGSTITIVGTGSTTITATQAADGNFLSANATVSLTVLAAPPTLSMSLSASSVVFAKLAPSLTTASNSAGVISYSSSDPSVATIDATTGGIGIVGIGSATFSVIQAADGNYTSGSGTAALTVTAAAPSLSVSVSSTSVVYGGTAPTLAATSNSAGSVTYSSSDSSVVSVSGSTLTVTGIGSAVITATQAADGNYAEATAQISLTVTAATPHLSTSLSSSTVTYGTSAPTLGFTSNSLGTVTYASSDTNVATIDASTGVITLVRIGSVNFSVMQAAAGNYASVTATPSLTVTAATPVFSVGLSSSSVIYGGSAPTLNYTSNSSGAVTYVSSDTSVATISGSTITLVGAGSTTITATQAADGNYNSVTGSVSLNVGVATPTLSVTLSTSSVNFASQAPTLSYTSNSPGAVTYSSSNTASVIIDASTGAITITGIGTAILTATQAATSNYSSASTTTTLNVTVATPTLTGFALSSASIAYGATAPTLTAPTSPSSGTITYSSSNSTVATLNGSTLTVVGIGTTTLTATQAAHGNYAGASTTITLTVTAATPTLSGFSLSASSVVYGTTAPTLTMPTSPSAGAITYASSNSAVASVSGSTITIVGIGTVSIIATQAPNGNYTSGTATASLTVTAATPTFSFALSSTIITYGQVAPTPSYTSNSAGTVTYTSDALGVVTISGSTLTVVGAGSATLTATLAANGNYSSASATATLTVNPEPTAIASTTAQVLTVGSAMTSFTPLVGSNGTAPLTYYVSSGTLPSGLTLDATTGAVTGTATTMQAAANVVFAVRDANASVAATTSTVSFTVNGRPTASATTTAQVLTVGTAMTSFVPLAASGGTGALTYYISSGMLPSGLTLDATTGAVTGTATTSQGAANVVFAAKDSNNAVAATTSTVSFTVNGRLTATATTTAQVLTVGAAMTRFTPLTGSNGTAPLTYYVSSGTLPSGLTLDATTGAVTGTATTVQAAADVVFAVRDANASVAATTSTVSFTVNAQPTAIATTTAQVLTVGTAMTSFTPLAGSGGTAPLTYYVSSGTLPSGLTLDATTGAVTSTATSSQGAGDVVFAVRDANASVAATTSTVSFTVNGRPTASATTTAQVLTVGTAMTSFVPLTATGGTGTLTYYVSSGTLPSGLTLDATTGAVTGTATASQGAANVVFAVSDANASVAATTSTVSFTVNAQPTATATTTAQVLTVGAAMTSFTPLVGSNGTAPLTYYVSSGTLPSGLALDATTGAVTGTATSSQGAADVVFAVRDANASVAATTSTVSFTVNGRPTASATTTAQVLTVGTAMTGFTPLAGSGGSGSLTYFVNSGTLPAGLSLDTSTGEVTGTPTNAHAVVTVIFAVKDSNLAVAATTSNVNFTINARPTAAATTTAQVLTVGAAMTSFIPLVGSNGTAPLTYYVSSGTLPSGLALDATTGAVTGTATTVQVASPVIFGVKDANNSVAVTTSTVSFTVNAPPTASATTTAQVLSVGAAMTSFTPLAGSGGTGTLTYFISSGTLPAGLSLNGTSGAVTGAPTMVQSAAIVVFSVKDSNQAVASTTSTVSFTVNGQPTATANSTAQALTVGAAMTSFSPLAGHGGTGTLTYYLSSGTLPTGLSLDGSTGAVTGTPTIAHSAVTLTFAVKDSNNAVAMTTSSVTFTVNALPVATATTTAQILTVGAAMASFVPLTATGGTGALTYYVSSGTLPSGLTLDATTGAVTGTATIVQAAANVVFAVRDANNASSATTSTVSFTVNAQPTAIATSTAQFLTVGTAMTGFTPLAGSGGTGALTYYVGSGTLPSGLSINSATGAVTGTPTAAHAVVTVVFSVKDSNNAVAATTSSVSFTINAKPTAIAVTTAQILTINAPMMSFRPLTGSGGTGILTYYISSGTLPSGLTFDTATGIITGTPTTLQAASSVMFAVKDANNSVAITTSTVSFTVNAPPTAVASQTAQVLTLGRAMTSFTPLVGSGGSGALVYYITGGSLPSGLSLNAATGAVTGIPTAAQTIANVTFAVRDANGSVATTTSTVSFTINDHVVATTLIASSIIQQGVAAAAFKPVSGAGGTGSLSYSVSPSLPSGLTMDGPSGVISGTPTLTHASSAFVVTVSDSLGDTNTANFSLAVLAAPAITAITPSLGTTSGGTTVLISGSSFSSDATVQFGSVLATSVVVNSASSITAISPPGVVGTVDVRVTSQGWQSPVVAADQFTYSTIIPTAISLSASSLSPVLGRPVTLTAHISPSTATGTISFKSGATVLGTSALSGGTAIFVTTGLSYGENSLTASYAGDGLYAASISAPLTVSCSRPNPALDSDVRGIVSAQTSIALRSTQTVIDVNRRRLETLHSDDQQGFTNGINIGFATPMSKPVYTVDAFQPNDNNKLSPTNQFGTDRLIVDNDEPRVTGWSGPAGLSPDISVWTSGNITVGKLNVDGVSVSNSFTTTGVTMGFDTRFTERLKVGFAGSVSYDDTKVGQNGSSNKALMLSGSGYASWALSDHIFIDSLLGYGSMSFDTKRYDSVGDKMITGKRSGSAFFGSLIGSYDQHTDALNSAVYSGFDAVYGQLDSYSETGSTDWALSFDKMALQSYSFIFGLRGQYDYPMSWGVLSPTGRVEYRKSLSPDSVQSLSYANGTPGSYQLTQSGAANWSLTTTVGIRASLRQGVNGSLELSNSSDMSTLHTYGLKGEIVWPF